MVSTPTATTKILNKTWDEASVNCDRYKNNIFHYFSNSINSQKSLINRIANIISDGFGKIFNRFNLYQSSIRTSLVRIEARLSATINNLSNYSKIITDKFANQLLNINEETSDRWNILLGKYHNTILSTKKDLNYIWKGSVSQQFKNIADSVYNQLDNAENLIRYNDPRRQIALGYSIVRSNGAIIRNISDGKIGEEINIQTIGGTIDSTITKINKE